MHARADPEGIVWPLISISWGVRGISGLVVCSGILFRTACMSSCMSRGQPIRATVGEALLQTRACDRAIALCTAAAYANFGYKILLSIWGFVEEEIRCAEQLAAVLHVLLGPSCLLFHRLFSAELCSRKEFLHCTISVCHGLAAAVRGPFTEAPGSAAAAVGCAA